MSYTSTEVPDSIDPSNPNGQPLGGVFSICGIAFNAKGELIAEYYKQNYAGYQAWRDYRYLNASNGEISEYKFGVKRFNKMPSSRHGCDCGLSVDRCQH